MLIGRQKEQGLLRMALTDEESMFVAVYGRRRVGKTYLIRETFENSFTFYHTGLANSSMKKQLAAWRSSMRDYGMKKTVLPQTWLDAFDQLKDLVKISNEEKKIIFIDEVPWMDTQRSGFIQALEHFWNGWASARKDVVLIICGSATSWIINKVIKNHGGLHNRVNMKIHLQPFTLYECELYAEHRKLGMNRRQLMECYMIMGGVPFYWSKLQRAYSLAQNIDNLFFSPDGELYHEFDELYASLFKNPDSYIKVVNTLGTKRIGMTREELIKEGGFVDSGALSIVLENLEACGFIRKYNRLGVKCNKAQFQLIDSYTLFYYKFIMGNQNNDTHFWSAQMGSPIYYNWCGLAFERVCLLHVPQIKKSLGISGVISNAYAWYVKPDESKAKGAQIDLVIDRNDNVINLCEIKYTRNLYEVSKSEEENMQNRRSRFLIETRTDKAVHLILISANTVVANTYSKEFQAIITSDALFAE